MQGKLRIDADEVQMGLLSAGLVCLSVVGTYLGVYFGLTTVRQGVQSTVEVLAERAVGTLGRLSDRVLDLVDQPDDLGEAVVLFDRYPFVSEVQVARRPPASQVDRCILVGTNLDQLRSGEISLEGATGFEVTSNVTPPKEREKLELKPNQPVQLASLPDRCVVTARSRSGAVHTFDVALKEEQDTTELADPFKGTRPGGGGTAAPSTPTPGASSAATPVQPDGPKPTVRPDEPIVVGDDGQSDFAGLVDELKILPDEARRKWAGQVKAGQFGGPSLILLLDDVRQVKGKDVGAVRAAFLAVLDARYMRKRKVGLQEQPLHGASPDELRAVVNRFLPGELVATANLRGSVSEALNELLKQIRESPTGPATASPGAALPAFAGGKPDETFFRELFEKDRVCRDCHAILEVVQKAYVKYTANIVTPPQFNAQTLHANGYLEYVPICPDPVNRGTFELDPFSAQIRCSVHGTRNRPWEPRKLYEQYFSTLDKAKIMVRQQGRRKDAIKLLQDYLARDSGKDDANLYVQAFLGRLLFEEEDYAEAVTVLQKLSDRYPNSVRFACQTSLCFYARANEHLALDYARRALKPKPEEIDRTLDEDTTLYECYLLRDQADWIRQNLPVRYKPDGTEVRLPPVKYADFALKTKPEWRSKVCYESIERVRDCLPKLLAAIRERKELQRLQHEIGERFSSLEGLPVYEKRQKTAALADLLRLKWRLRDLMTEVVEKSGVKALAPTRVCPNSGLFYLDAGHNIQCTTHTGILPPKRMDASPPPEEWEYGLLNVAIPYATLALDPALAPCLDRQRTILLQFRNEETRVVQVPQTASVEELVKHKKIDAKLAQPGPAERYAISKGSGEGILGCSVHLSLQRLWMMVPELDTGVTPE